MLTGQLGRGHSQGSALYPTIRFANHSCSPNAYVENYYDNTGVLIATHPLAAGEEVLISYVDELDAADVRAVELAGYGFECDCDRCSQNC